MTPNQYLRIAGAALNQTPFDWANNRANILEAIRQAKEENIQILCLPELCLTGYGCEDVFLSDWLPEKALKELLIIVPHCSNIVVSIGLPIRLKGLLYNCACLIENGEIAGFTAKQFLANDGVHYEPRWFTQWPAELIEEIEIEGNFYKIGDVLYETAGIKIGFEICEDAWRAERPGIRHHRKGVQLILNPSASHFAFNKSKIRYGLVIGGSKQFDCTYLYANLLGNEAGRMIYDGEVLIAHQGKLIQRNDRLSFKNVNLVYADINFHTHETSHAPLTPDDLEKEYEFWEATSLGLFDYMRKSKSKGFVLSLSGGADSSACAIMVSEMVKKGLRELGTEKFILKSGLEDLIHESKIISLSFEEQVKSIVGKILTCAYQGTKNSGNETFKSAEQLALSIGATFYHWSIDEEIKGYTEKIEQALGRKLSWETDDIALQNIQARSRSPIIWMLANINHALLITTSNRSEGDVGYATMDGDTSGSIAPIAGVDKHFIRNWLIWAEEKMNQEGLHAVNALTPTAELRPKERTQTDEKDLMPYSILVEIERLAIKERKSPKVVFEELKNKNPSDANSLRIHVKKFYLLWTRNQWKRERIAPSFHLDDFNIDPRSWCRFPILSSGFEEELKML
jgi:NAD+ synthase (glutamine-hydrolysing)